MKSIETYKGFEIRETGRKYIYFQVVSPAGVKASKHDEIEDARLAIDSYVPTVEHPVIPVCTPEIEQSIEPTPVSESFYADFLAMESREEEAQFLMSLTSEKKRVFLAQKRAYESERKRQSRDAIYGRLADEEAALRAEIEAFSKPVQPEQDLYQVGEEKVGCVLHSYVQSGSCKVYDVTLDATTGKATGCRCLRGEECPAWKYSPASRKDCKHAALAMRSHAERTEQVAVAERVAPLVVGKFSKDHISSERRYAAPLNGNQGFRFMA